MRTPDILTEGAADFRAPRADAPKVDATVNGAPKPELRNGTPANGEGTPVFDAKKVNGTAVNGAKNAEPTFHDLVQRALATPGAERVMTGVDAAAASGLRPVRTRESLPVRTARTAAPRKVLG